MPKLNCLNLPQPVFSWTPSFWCPAARTGSRSRPGSGCSSRESRRQPTATEAEETVVSSYSGTLTPSHLAPFLLRKLLITVRQTVFCALSSGIGSQTKSINHTAKYDAQCERSHSQQSWMIKTRRIYSLKNAYNTERSKKYVNFAGL